MSKNVESHKISVPQRKQLEQGRKIVYNTKTKEDNHENENLINRF